MTVDGLGFPRSPGVPSWPDRCGAVCRPVSGGKSFGTITERFSFVVEMFPDRTAVVDDQRVTYRELQREVQWLASELRVKQLDVSYPVAILAPAGISSVTAILGTLFAGGRYLPLDIRDSQERWAQTINEMGCRMILAPQNLLEQTTSLLDGCPDLSEVEAIETFSGSRQCSEPISPVQITPDRPACVFYTSGSSGKSVGVAMSHGFVVSDICRQAHDLEIHCDDRFDLLFSTVFSASLAPMFSALLNGASLWIYDLAGQGVHQLGSWLGASGISISNMSVSTMRSLLGRLDEGSHFDDLRLLSVGGEPLRAADVSEFQAKVHSRCWLQNAMATTETRTYAQLFISHDDLVSDPVPVGLGVNGRCIRIENEQGIEVPAGQVGAITVDSSRLADGYVNDSGLTAERFRTLADGTTRHQTGDCGYIDDRGRLVCVGRSDSIVKIRGHRVETHSVERGFEAISAVRRATVLVYSTDDQDDRLAAFLLMHEPVSIDNLRQEVAEHIPHFAIPQKIVQLESLPQTLTGKVDRQKLLSMIADHESIGTAGASVDGEDSATTSSTEQALMEIWGDVLGHPVGITDKFFSLGGDSLSAVLMLARVSRDLRCNLSYQQLLDHSTIQQLGRILEQSTVNSSTVNSSMVRVCEGPTPRIHPPVFLVSGIIGHAIGFKAMVNEIKDQALDVYVFETEQVGSMSGEAVDIANVATRFVEQIEAIAEQNSVVVGGYSWGGLVAQEIACQLAERGIHVALLAIFDAPAPRASLPARPTRFAVWCHRMQNMPHWIRYDFLSTSISANANRIRGAFEQIVKRIMNRQSEADQPNLRRYFGGAGPVDAKLKNFRAKYRGYVGYRPSQFKGRAIVFRARAQSMSDPLIGAMGWQYFIEPVPQVRVVKGSHVSMMRSPYVGEISPFLKQSFDNKGTGRPRV